MSRDEAGLGLSISVAATGDGGTLVTLIGDLDMASAPELRRVVATAVDDGELELDMRACGFVDSSGIAALVTAARQAGEQGRTLKIRGAQDRVRRILELAGLTSHRRVVLEPGDPAD